MKRVERRTPSGKVTIRKKQNRVGFARCANCHQELHGMPRAHTAESGKFAKTERKPSRAYGGYFCGNCTRELFKERARMI